METTLSKFREMTLFAFFMLSFFANAQQSLNAGGGSSGALSFSIGQTFTSCQSGLKQGVQQAYEVQVVTGADDQRVLLQMAAFPNPVTDVLMLTTQLTDYDDCFYQLYNLQGNLITQGVVDKQQITLSFSGYSESAYLLKIIQRNQLLKTFKIIKK